MKRLVIPSLLLAALASWAANPHLMVVARKNVAAAGGGTDFTQDGNCVGAWYMNGDGGTDEIETDRSGNGYTLAESSGDELAVVTNRPPGYAGTSRKFDSSASDHLVLTSPTGAITNMTSAVTAAAWVNLDTSAGTSTIMSKWAGSPNNSFVFQITSGNTLRCYISSNGSAAELVSGSASTIADDTWHHVAMTFDATGQEFIFYIDGSPDQTNATTATELDANAGAFKIGLHSAATDQIDGWLDEEIVFDRILSAAEINDLYTDGTDGSNGGND